MSDKPHAPTKRRLERARASGDVALSTALVQSAGFCAALLLLPGMLAALVDHFRASFQRALTTSSLEVSAHELVRDVFMLVLPVLVAASVASLAAGLLQTRGSFTGRLESDARRNPLRAFARRFSPEARASLGLALSAGAIVAVAATWLLQSHLESLGNAVGSSRAAATLGAMLSLRLAWIAGAITSVFGLAHFALVRRARWVRLRMSDAELRRELRDEQGDATLRGARRRTHRELLDASTPPSRPSGSSGSLVA